MISFVMPVRNSADYVGQMIESISERLSSAWELIVVDDHSTDETFHEVCKLAEMTKNIIVTKNPGRGQVQAINCGMEFVSGDFIKIIDADDLLIPWFSDYWNVITEHPASYHDALVLDEAKQELSYFKLSSAFARLNLVESLKRLRISPPRWSWTFSRQVAQRIFPLPAELPSPHEDVFIGLKIKKQARYIKYIPEPLYVYRQYHGQTYGGTFNFSPELTEKRAKAMLQIIDLILKSDIVDGLEQPENLTAISRTYYSLLAKKNLSWPEILTSHLAFKEQARVLAIKKFPGLASFFSRRRALRKFKGKI